MHESHNEIRNICRFASNFLDMNTFFIYTMGHRKLEYIYYEVPLLLKELFANTIDMLSLDNKPSEYDALFHTNSYKMNFISTKITIDNSYLGNLVVGPYLLEEPTASMIEFIISKNNISISLKNIITQYYLSLPLLSTYKAKTNAEFLTFIAANYHTLCLQNSKIGSINYDFRTEYSIKNDIIKKNTDLPIEALERRYNAENAALYAVETGNKKLLEKTINDYRLYVNVADRVPNDPLRSRKNMSFVLNTILRKSAEKGGVHPIYLDAISEKFAIQIEKCTSIRQILDLRDKMFFEYCDMVKKLSLKNYSFFIQKAIEYIRINLNQDLNLKSISNFIHINPCELSTQFKKETGQTITEYINNQRINEALYILQNQTVSITKAAYMVGFNDVNYFTKVFRKIKGITPSEYRKRKL